MSLRGTPSGWWVNSGLAPLPVPRTDTPVAAANWEGERAGDVAQWAGPVAVEWRMRPTFRIAWSDEDQGWVATAEQFPSALWVDADPARALDGLITTISDILSEREDDDW